MRDKFSKTILLVSFVLGLILVYGTNIHPSVLSRSTIEKIQLNGSISDYGYEWDFEFVIHLAQIEITNMGPLDATLHDANITISFNNRSSMTIPIKKTVKLPTGVSYNHTIAPPELKIEDESRAILEKMMEQHGHVDYWVTLKALASCGKYKVPIEKTFSGS